MKYSFIANGAELVRKDFDVAPVEAGWIPFTEAAKPVVAESQTLVELSPTIASGVATQRFDVQSKADATPVRVTPSITEVANWALEEELIERGLDTALKNAINSLSNPKDKAKATARFAKKPTTRRNDPLISALAAGLGWNTAFVDDLFLKSQVRSTT